METLQLVLNSFTICLNKEHLGYLRCCVIFYYVGFPTKDSYLPLNWTTLDNFYDPGKGSSKRKCIANFLKSKKQFSIYNNALTIWVSKAKCIHLRKATIHSVIRNPDHFVENCVGVLLEELWRQNKDACRACHSKSSRINCGVQTLILIIYIIIKSNRFS